jgi:hypothetical protein
MLPLSAIRTHSDLDMRPDRVAPPAGTCRELIAAARWPGALAVFSLISLEAMTCLAMPGSDRDPTPLSTKLEFGF